MSDLILKVIPTDPNFTPSKALAGAAKSLLASMVPDADDVRSLVRDAVGFIDPGSNLESISCPQCRKAIDQDWWSDAMDRASKSQFSELAVDLPCCGQPSTLNDLTYDWPVGFARFSLEARNPGVKELTPDQIQGMQEALGTPVRVIWARL